MEQAYGALFLDNVNRFFDLSLYPSLAGDDLGGLRSLSVEREGKQVYALAVSPAQSGGTPVFTMTAPYALTLGTAQAKSEILTPLRELAGADALAKPEDLTPYGLADGAGRFTLTYADGTSAVIRVGRQEGTGTYVFREGSDVLMLVPTANLSFFYDTALQVVGQNLVSVSLGDLASLRIGDHVYRISGTPPALEVTLDGEEELLDNFQNGVYTALNRISIQDAWDGTGQTVPLLEMQVETTCGDGTARTADYAFYELEGRRCGVAVNGQPAFLCSRSAVQALAEAALG